MVQGLTEFLPVSSSGHLVIFQQLLGLKEPELFFDIVLHVGTLFSTLVIFRKEILKILFLPRACLLIVVGSIPTALAGFLLLDVIEQSFGSVRAAGVGLFITGTWLWFTYYVPRKKILLEGFLFSDITFKKAFFIGLAQSVALFPGISRSGMTIATALFLRAGRKDAATFSFLLSIPSIIGAVGLKLYHMETLPLDQMHILLPGFTLAFLVGTASLWVLIKIVLQGSFFKFSYYCWAVGLGAIVVGYLI